MQVPDVWMEVLKTVNKYANGVIAGGALRDLDNDRPVKDVDIFFTAIDHHAWYKTVNRVCGELEVALDMSNKSNKDEYRQRGGVITGGGVFSYKGFVFELIGNDPRKYEYPRGEVSHEIVDTFDVGLARISADETGRVIKTDEYLHDQVYKQFTVLHSHNYPGLQKTVRRWARHYEEKYQGWPLVFPKPTLGQD